MDLDNSHPLVKSEFIAVVLAGFGHELQPLTGSHGEEPCPKALLPIGNTPMLNYILSWLEPSGITDVLLVCPTAHRISIAGHIHSDASAAFPSLRIDLQTYGDQQDISFGTCAILRHFANRIERDFVVLPCDFIPPPSLSLSTILNKFRQESTLGDAVCTTCWYEVVPPVEKHTSDGWSSAQQSVPIVWDEKTGTLLHVDIPDPAARISDDIQLKMSMLSMYPRTKISRVLQDSNVYACNRSLLDVLQRKPVFESFRKEFIPWLCKINHQDSQEVKYKPLLRQTNRQGSQGVSLQHSTLYERDFERSHSNGDMFDYTKDRFKLRVGIVTHRVENGSAGRANNLHSYLELNRRFLEQTTQNAAGLVVNKPPVDAKAQISADSVLGHSTRVEERANIKKSVIGRHCVIGKAVKIVGCVILDHCVIADGAKLDGCILGKNTKVGEKSELSRCVTQAGYEVDAGGNHRNEKLDVSDWTAGSAYEDNYDSSSSGEDSETE